jgi:uncharacterized protein YbjQ (UPF0145 family)
MTPIAGRVLRTAAVLAAVVFAPAVAARDDRLLFDIRAALDSAEGRDRFDDTVEFYWGDQPYPAPRQTFDIHSSLRKTFAPTRTDLQACQRSFIEALAALRDQAKAAGGNAVVGIKSVYKNREFRSETQFECRAGWVVTGVMLEGQVVKLPPRGVTAIQPGY